MAEDKKVKGNELVTIYYTDKSAFHKAGQSAKVHAEQAAKLIASGKATDKAPAKK